MRLEFRNRKRASLDQQKTDHFETVFRILMRAENSQIIKLAGNWTSLLSSLRTYIIAHILVGRIWNIILLMIRIVKFWFTMRDICMETFWHVECQWKENHRNQLVFLIKLKWSRFLVFGDLQNSSFGNYQLMHFCNWLCQWIVKVILRETRKKNSKDSTQEGSFNKQNKFCRWSVILTKFSSVKNTFWFEAFCASLGTTRKVVLWRDSRITSYLWEASSGATQKCGRH